jgi:hypothetical protein
MKSLRRLIAVVVSVVLTAIAIISAAPTVPQEQQAATSASAGTALAALETLPMKGRAPKTGYTREAFGSGWRVVDGCDTRQIILFRDLEDVVLRDECTVATGVLSDPYTATRIDFSRENADMVQIDHVVALSDAWQKGAQQLTKEERADLANDPLELLAVDGPANQQKGDGDAATWLPPNGSFRCEYIARQIAVKQKYRLWVTEAEKRAMATVLARCPATSLPV